MNEPSLREQYGSLTAPAESGLVFGVVDLPGAQGASLGRSSGGPALLVQLDGIDQDLVSIELKNLFLKPNVTCRTNSASGAGEGLFTVCACTTEDPRLQMLFLDALQCLVSADGFGTPSGLRSAVEGLVELFSALQRAAKTSVLGLWGEIFLIGESADADVLLDAWHQLPNDHYDFARGDHRLEVKTTIGRRQHSVSLDQLTPPAGVEVAFASIVTESSTAGSSVIELIAATAARCAAPDAAARLLAGASQALGSEVQHWSEQRYDVSRARESLRLLPEQAIPRPTVEDSRIWDVRFRVDLEDVEAAATAPFGPLTHGLPYRPAEGVRP
jgi:hypothetical protein